MAISDGKIQLDDGSNTIEVSVPLFGYKTTIQLPFDIQKLDDGSYGIFDNGASYDIRSCECEMQLNATEQNILNDFISDGTKGRAKDIIITTNASSGFYPFGPDKGDVGPFTCTFEIAKHEGIGEAPYKYFKDQIIMVNTGSWPSYSIPTEVSEGQLTIDTIANNRFPPNWFEPDYRYKYAVSIEQNSTSQYIDRGANADSFITSFSMVSNQTKAAKTIERLVDTTRSVAFNIITVTNYYLFGRDKGSEGTYSVKLIQDKIVIQHNRYDNFEYELNITYLSGPT